MEPKTSSKKPVKPDVPFNAVSFTANLLNHSGIVSLFDQAVVSGANFLSGMIIGRFSSKDEFGLYMLGMTIIMVVTDLQTSLITTPYMVFNPQTESSSRTGYTGSTLVHQTALSLLTGVILFLAGIILTLGFGPSGLESVILILAFFGIFMLFRDYVRRILFARLHMHKAFVLDTFVSVIQVAGLGILAYTGLLSAARAYMVLGTVAGIAVLFWLISSRKEITIESGRIITDAARNWTFGKWVFASGLVWTISMNLYPWFITAFHGTSATGVWAACMGVMALGNPLLLGIQNYLGPRIANVHAHNTHLKLRKYVYRNSMIFTGLLAPVLLILIFFGEKLLTTIYGDQYAGNGIVVGLLGVNLTLSAIVFSFSRALFAMERANLDFKVNLSALAVLFGSGIWLVRSKGPLGAAIGLIAANAVSSCIRWVIFKKLVNSSAVRKSKT